MEAEEDRRQRQQTIKWEEKRRIIPKDTKDSQGLENNSRACSAD
jgi:hypothetical protein